MDSVPFAFCDSVATLLSDLSVKELCNLNPANSQFRTWTAATNQNATKRQNLGVSLHRIGDRWFYEISSDDQLFSFAEFKGMNKQHIRVSYVGITSDTLGRAISSSEEEVSEIAAYTPQFVNLASLFFNNLRDKHDSMRTILGCYRDCSFSQIHFYNYTQHEDFLLHQLESEWLQELNVRDPGLNRPGPLRSAAEEFARHKKFHYFCT